MADSTRHHKTIGIIGTYLPRKCGIATFTYDLCNAMASNFTDDETILAMAIDDNIRGYDYPRRVRFQIRDTIQADYIKAAEFTKVYQCDVLFVQHEYGIYGGTAGNYILSLLKNINIPVITTLHTILENPNEDQKKVLLELARHSERLISMSERGIKMLQNIYGIEKEKIIYIPHGIHDVPFIDPSFYKDKFGVENRKVILTFGLLSPNKGIEVMIDALPKIVKECPEVVYLVVGSTHPHVKQHSGEAYRYSLMDKVKQYGLTDNVVFYNQFVGQELLSQYIIAADVYVTPYLAKEQITSGTLSYALGAGKAVVSTPYWHAEELLADSRGMLVPFNDPDAMANAIIVLLKNDNTRNSLRKQAYQYCRPMVWKEVGKQYLELADKMIHYRRTAPRITEQMPAVLRMYDELPEIKLDHLRIMTDSAGILQHAMYTTPNKNHGYCIDDNARALIVAEKYYHVSHDKKIFKYIQTYLSFILHAFNEKTKRFRNFMSYDRTWEEDIGSEDSHGRALWGLGTSVKYAPTTSIRNISSRLFLEGLPVTDSFQSPRALAFILLGIHTYLEIFSGDAGVRRMRDRLATKLYSYFKNNMTDKTAINKKTAPKINNLNMTLIFIPIKLPMF